MPRISLILVQGCAENVLNAASLFFTLKSINDMQHFKVIYAQIILFVRVNGHSGKKVNTEERRPTVKHVTRSG